MATPGYYIEGKDPDLSPPCDPAAVARKLLAKVVRLANGCWEFTGAGDRYGTITVNNQQVSAHRLSYVLFVGPTYGLHVRHRCDNKRCIRPEHLLLGTHQDNMNDANERMRRPFGEKNVNAKLTVPVVLQIRADMGSDSALASKYGISRAVINKIRAGKAWRHV